MKNKILSIAIMLTKLAFYGFVAQCLAFSVLLAFDGSAQKLQSVREVYIDLDLRNTTLISVFKTIESKTDYDFAYDEANIDQQFKMDLVGKNKTVGHYLLEISKKASLKFKQINRMITVDVKDEKRDGESNLEIVLQGATVTGKVTSADDGSGLPGVNVIIKGTSQGTVTDLEGTYKIDVPDESSVLVFSSVGYVQQELTVGNQTVIDIELLTDVTALEEIVVVGYGTMRKSDLTGSLAKIETEPLRELPNINVMSSLQGMVPGLNIGAVDNAGEEPDISIRGQNTLSSSSADNRPLFVVDGMIYRGSMVDLNTADIESVEILKDASAASIYGSQSSNGVVLITTKKGKMGKPVISYDGYYSMQVPSNKLEPFNGAELEQFTFDAYWTDSRIPPDYLQQDPNFTFAPRLKNIDVTEGYLNGVDTDWWGMLTDNGSINSHNLGIRGRTESVGYFVSLGYTGQKGFIINDQFDRYNARVNMDTKITNWLTIGGETFMTKSDYSGVSPGINQTFHMQPWAPIYDANGEYLLEPIVGLNPFLQIQQDDSDQRFNLFGKFFADVKLPFLEGFNYRINYSHNYRTVNQDRFNPWGANYTGFGYRHSYQFYDWILDNIVSYKRTFNNDHKVDLTLLYGVEKREYNFTEASAQNFTKMTLGYNSLEAGDPTLNSVNTGAEQETSLYTMARLFYSYKNKYMITGTIRRDGFSGFGTNDKVGIFPSIGIAWALGDEGFLADNVSFLDNLKLRVSYGTTGRRGVGRYETLAKMTVGPSRVFGDGGSATIGQYISTMANNELGWESTTGINIGLDFGIFDNRLYGNFEYYNNDTKDILYNIQLPYMTGFGSVPTNIGKVHNYGVEFMLTGVLVRRADFNWEATVNFARNRNQIKSILGFDNDGDGVEDDIVTNQLFIGEPQNVVFDYKIIGMWQLEDEQQGEIPNGFFAGQYKIEDSDGDGVYTPDDRQILGYRDPSYRLGVSTRLSYKNWGLYIFVNSIQGGKDYYYADGSPYTDGSQYKIDQISYSNASGWDYWMPENPNAKYRRLDIPSQFHPSPYDQRNFVRLQDVSLSYTFGRELMDKVGLGNLKLYVSGKNLLTITNWEGWDPETGVGIAAGLPVMAGYTFGVNLEF